MNGHPRGEQGDAVTEMVVLVPVLLLLIMTIVQFGLWYHAEHVVQAAAQEGVRAARSLDGTADSGRRRAEQFLAMTGPSLIHDPVVGVSRDERQSRVEVSGTVVGVIPGLRMVVDARAVSATESFRADR